MNGSPFIEHKKASNVFKNLQKEAKGIELNEDLYKSVQNVILTSKNIKECYHELAEKTKFSKEDYFISLKNAMVIWDRLF